MSPVTVPHCVSGLGSSEHGVWQQQLSTLASFNGVEKYFRR